MIYTKLLNSMFHIDMMKMFVFLAILSYDKLGLLAINASTAPAAPALIIFGDSIMDVGNNNYIKTIVKCNFPPYGRDFKQRIPTGRFSNGRVPSDMLAEAVGVKRYMPAYLDPSLQLQDLLTGVSFASGGCGYDPLTAKLVSVLSLEDQLELFKEYTNKIKAGVGEERAKALISESIYIICTGSDDIANTYLSSPFRITRYNIPSYTDLMANSASRFLQELYGLGARRIGVMSLPAIGCVPSQRTMGGGIARHCSEQANQAAKLANSKLSSVLDALRQRFPDANFVFMDIYDFFLSLVLNPAQYGFEIGNKGCCGTGKIEVSILCTKLVDAKTCVDDTNYVFWDSYHPTEKAYKVLTDMVRRQYLSKL